MALTITAAELKSKEQLQISDDNNVLAIFWCDKLGKFITEFNLKFMASSKTIASPLKKFNDLAVKHKLAMTHVVEGF